MSDNTILVTADIVGLYSSIPHQTGLIALKEALDKRLLKKIPTDKLIKMAELALSNNFFEFNSDTFQQISETAMGTKFEGEESTGKGIFPGGKGMSKVLAGGGLPISSKSGKHSKVP